jgi:hypothetical protein
MARPRSLIVSMEITVVGRAHNCRQSDNHRLEKGMKRLTVKSDGDEHHYCLACAKTFLMKDIERLQTLLAEVNSETVAIVTDRAPHVA